MKTEKLFMNPALIQGMNFFIRAEINGTENLKKKIMKPSIGSLKESNTFLTTSIKKNLKRGDVNPQNKRFSLEMQRTNN